MTDGINQSHGVIDSIWLQKSIQYVQKLFFLDGFFNVFHGAEFLAFDFNFFAVVTRDEDNGNGNFFPVHLLQELEAVEVGHTNI